MYVYLRPTPDLYSDSQLGSGFNLILFSLLHICNLLITTIIINKAPKIAPPLYNMSSWMRRVS